MPFNTSNFLVSYLPSAKALEIKNSAGNKVYTLVVCNYQKSNVSNNNLLIFLEDNNFQKQYTLDFPSKADAIIAQIALKDAINSLKVNCDPLALTPPSPSQTPIPITYLQYKGLQQTSTLFVAQWYDVTDSTDLLGFGGVTMRLLAKTIDDYEPSGIILGTRQLITITTLDDTVQRFEEGEKKILALNNSSITYDSDSSKLTASTGSTLTSTNSNNIDIKGGSIGIVTNCSYVEISNNSNVSLENAVKVVIDNIQQNLSSLTFDLLNVSINPSDSIGKVGKLVTTNQTTDLTLESYNSVTDQEYKFTSNTNSITLTLSNQILQANGEFRIKYSGSGSGNTIEIEDTDSNLLFTLDDGKKDIWAVFRFNKTSQLYEFVRLDFTKVASHTVYQVNVSSVGQVNFSLPIPASDPLQLEMFINGQKQLYGPDFTYSSPNIAIYQNRHYTLQIGDEVEFLIF